MNKKISSTMPELHPVPVTSPWYHIGIDFVGPITPLSRSGNRFILTMSDYFTKWVEAVALPSKCAQGVAESLFKVWHTVWCDIICYFQVHVMFTFKYCNTFALTTLNALADLYAHGLATCLYNWPREGISQPAQWGTHEESRNQASPHHSIPSTGNLYLFPSYSS